MYPGAFHISLGVLFRDEAVVVTIYVHFANQPKRTA